MRAAGAGEKSSVCMLNAISQWMRCHFAAWLVMPQGARIGVACWCWHCLSPGSRKNTPARG